MKQFTRVLIVDDENIFRNTLRNLIFWEDEGFFLVGFAENGQQALDLLGATMPQIVITDVAMPVMNGVELLKHIQHRNSRQTAPPIQTIVVSGFDTFSYVRDAMKYGAADYILKSELTAETLLARLNHLVEATEKSSRSSSHLDISQFFTNLLNRSYTNTDFIQQELQAYNLTIRFDSPLFLIKTFCSDSSEQYVQSADAYRIMTADLKHRPAAVFLYKGCCMILGNMSALDATCDALLKHAEDYPSLYWGVRRNLSDISACCDAMSDFLQIPQQFFYAPNRKCFQYQKDLSFGIPEAINTKSITDAVIASDFQQIELAFGDFLSRCIHNNVSPYALQKYCEQVIYGLIFETEKKNPDITSINVKKISYFRKIDHSSTIDELCDVLDGILSDIASLIHPCSENNSKLITAVNQYIEKNYMKPVQLSDVADYVHVSYYHLSRIINNHYNETFNDYLNQVRVNASKRLLSSTNLSVGQIAEDVGFANQSYFGKIFKKQTGMSPRLYRISQEQRNN